jgi:hypothetical protein
MGFPYSSPLKPETPSSDSVMSNTTQAHVSVEEESSDLPLQPGMERGFALSEMGALVMEYNQQGRMNSRCS